jgi:hypothetical protein
VATIVEEMHRVRSHVIIFLVLLNVWGGQIHAETWESGDIGSVGQAGSSSYNEPSASFTVEGAGAAIGGAADACHFVAQSGTDHVEIIARVASQTSTSPRAKAGLMLRQSWLPGSPQVTVAVTPQNGIEFVHRSVANAMAQTTFSATAPAAPVWLKLVKRGSSVVGSYSTDGLTWTLAGQATIAALGSRPEVGLAVSGHSDPTLGSAVFDRITYMPFLPPLGTGLNLWLRSDLGVEFNASNRVTAWRDQSGYSNDAVQSVVADQPTLVDQVLAGKPVLRFLASNTEFLTIPDHPSLNFAQTSLFAVFKRNSGSTIVGIVSKYPNSGTNGYIFRSINATTLQSWMSNSLANGSFSSGNYIQASGVFNQVDSKLYVNNTLAGSVARTVALANSPSPLYIGSQT